MSDTFITVDGALRVLKKTFFSAAAVSFGWGAVAAGKAPATAISKPILAGSTTATYAYTTTRHVELIDDLDEPEYIRSVNAKLLQPASFPRAPPPFFTKQNLFAMQLFHSKSGKMLYGATVKVETNEMYKMSGAESDVSGLNYARLLRKLAPKELDIDWIAALADRENRDPEVVFVYAHILSIKAFEKSQDGLLMLPKIADVLIAVPAHSQPSHSFATAPLDMEMQEADFLRLGYEPRGIFRITNHHNEIRDISIALHSYCAFVWQTSHRKQFLWVLPIGEHMGPKLIAALQGSKGIRRGQAGLWGLDNIYLISTIELAQIGVKDFGMNFFPSERAVRGDGEVVLV